MATTTVPQALHRGGGFLVASTSPADVFTPADVTDDQRLIGQTAAEFVADEVIPAIPELEKHTPGLLAQILKKAGEIGLLGRFPKPTAEPASTKSPPRSSARKSACTPRSPSRSAAPPASARFPSCISARKSRRKNICRRSPPANCSARIACPSRKRVPTHSHRALARNSRRMAKAGF